MRRISFTENNRSGNLLHIEVPGAIVNIRVGLTDNDDHPMTLVTISPMDETRMPEDDGTYWYIEDIDGTRYEGMNARIVRQLPDSAGHTP